MLRQFSTKRILSFFTIDLMGTLAMLFAAASLRAEVGLLPDQVIAFMETFQFPYYSFWGQVSPGELIPGQVYLLVAIIWPFFFIIFSVYDGKRNGNLKSECLNVFLVIIISTLTLAGTLYFSYRETPRVLILFFFLFDATLLIGVRLVWGLTRTIRTRSNRFHRRVVLVIGAGQVGRNVVKQLQKYALADINLIGFLDDDFSKHGCCVGELPVLGSLDQSQEFVETYGVQDAVVALPLRAHEKLVDICETLQTLSVRVHVIPDLFALSFPHSTLDGFGGIPVIDLGKPGIQGWQQAVKRAFDVVAVFFGLILLSPLYLIITLIIKLDSKGPVIYKQLRIGENGQPFTMFKFRSMRVDADPELHKQHIARLIRDNLNPEQLSGSKGGSLKIEHDPRITRVGQFLRKSSLDELPQLVNVLLGEMSLVGPRPPLLYEVDLYKDWHKQRFEVQPGITGIWQVRGRNLVSFDEMVRMDIEYIEHQSIWLDIILLLQTPRAVFEARGAG